MDSIDIGDNQHDDIPRRDRYSFSIVVLCLALRFTILHGEQSEVAKAREAESSTRFTSAPCNVGIPGMHGYRLPRGCGRAALQLAASG